MEIPELEAAMREYHIDQSLITELRLAAAPLHPLSVGPVIEGMDEAASLRYVSHVVREMAAVLRIQIKYPDVLTMTGFPLIEPPGAPAPPSGQQVERRSASCAQDRQPWKGAGNLERCERRGISRVQQVSDNHHQEPVWPPSGY